MIRIVWHAFLCCGHANSPPPKTQEARIVPELRIRPTGVYFSLPRVRGRVGDPVSRYVNKQLVRETRRGRVDRVADLLGRRAEVDYLANDGFTPLSRACYQGHTEVVKLLFESGADPNAGARDGANPLFWASVRGHDEIVRLLLAHGADANSARRSDGSARSALHAAVSRGHVTIATVLIEAGASVDRLCLYGRAEEANLQEVLASIKQRRDIARNTESEDPEGGEPMR